MSYQNGPRIVTNGLVLCLDAGNNKSYPGTGTTWTDLSGNGNNGTLTNGPTFSSSNKGSIAFDGTNDYVSNTLSSSLSSSFTFICMVNLQSIPNTVGFPKGFLVSEVSAYGNYWAFLGAMESKWHWGIYNGTSNPYIQSNATPSIGVWKYITGVRNIATNTISLYVDGVLDSSLNHSTLSIPTYSVFTIGGQVSQPAGQNRVSSAQIALAQVYNRALSATEVAQNYNATKGRFNL